jgi:hypothetical protein
MIKQLAVSAAAAATLLAAPASAQELAAPMTKFFVSIPLDAPSKKELGLNFGLQFQGSRPWQTVQLDYQTYKFLPAAIAAVEVKYVVAGAVALGAIAAVAHKDRAVSESFAQQQQAQKAACPQAASQNPC